MSVVGNVDGKLTLKGKINKITTIHGESAYEIAVVNGFKGSEAEWLESLKGEKGDIGEPGIQGPKGDPGEKGEKGEQGSTPQAGVDYYTPVEKAELMAEVAEYAEQAEISAGKAADEAINAGKWMNIAEQAAVSAESNATNSGQWSGLAAKYAQDAKGYANSSAQNVETTILYRNEAEVQANKAARYAESINPVRFANAIIDDVAGENVLRIEDVSPVHNEIAVTVSGVDDPTAVTVKRYGRNLTSTVFDNKAVVGDGASHYIDNSAATGVLVVDEYIPGTQYTVSLDVVRGDDVVSSSTDAKSRLLFSQVTYTDGTMEYIDIVNVGTGSIHCSFVTAIGKTVKAIDFRKQSRWTSGTITLNNLQVEVGTTATDYEPYAEPVNYVPTADGTVSEMTIFAPTTTLVSDTTGAVISCTYVKDTARAIDGLRKRLAALETLIL